MLIGKILLLYDCLISRHDDMDLPSLFARLSSDALFGAKEGFGISVMIKKQKQHE